MGTPGDFGCLEEYECYLGARRFRRWRSKRATHVIFGQKDGEWSPVFWVSHPRFVERQKQAALQRGCSKVTVARAFVVGVIGEK